MTVFPIAISGASGHLGRLIIDELLDGGVKPSDVIAITRTPQKLGDFRLRGVNVHRGDFDRPGPELDAAFVGANRALIISTMPEAPYVEGKRFLQQKAGIDAARRAGVPHVFYTSALNPEPPRSAIWKTDHYLTEQYLRTLDLQWTILRHSEWPDWHLEESWKPAMESGLYHSASGAGQIGYITREDTAAADAGALLRADAAGKIYDVTGPEAVSARDIFAAITELTCRPVEVRDVSTEEFGRRLLARGVEAHFVPIFQMVAEATKLGKYELVTDHASQLARKRLKSLREFLATRLAKDDV